MTPLLQRGDHAQDAAAADYEGQLRVLHAEGDLRAARVHCQHDARPHRLREQESHPRRHQASSSGDQGVF